MSAVITLGKAPAFTATVMENARITSRPWTPAEIDAWRQRHRSWRRWGWLYEDWGRPLGLLPRAIAIRCGVPRHEPSRSDTLVANCYIEGHATAFEVQL